MAFEEINRDHFLKAFDFIKKNGIPYGRESAKYDVCTYSINKLSNNQTAVSHLGEKNQ